MTDQVQQLKPGAIVKAVFYILGLAALVYGFNAFLDAKIDGRLRSPVVTKQIAEQVRPFLIFSGTGVVLVDNGAMPYLENLEVLTNAANRIPQSVIVTPKQYLAHAPLITGIDQVGAVARGQRGPGISWVYGFEWSFVMEPGVAPVNLTTAKQDRYRLEIIK